MSEIDIYGILFLGHIFSSVVYIIFVPEDKSSFLIIIFPLLSFFGVFMAIHKVLDRWEYKDCRWFGHNYKFIPNDPVRNYVTRVPPAGIHKCTRCDRETLNTNY